MKHAQVLIFIIAVYGVGVGLGWSLRALPSFNESVIKEPIPPSVTHHLSISSTVVADTLFVNVHHRTGDNDTTFVTGLPLSSPHIAYHFIPEPQEEEEDHEQKANPR